MELRDLRVKLARLVRLEVWVCLVFLELRVTLDLRGQKEALVVRDQGENPANQDRQATLG